MAPRAPEPPSVSLELDPLSIQSTFNPDRVEIIIIIASAVSRNAIPGDFTSNTGQREQAPISGIIPEIPGWLARLCSPNVHKLLFRISVF